MCPPGDPEALPLPPGRPDEEPNAANAVLVQLDAVGAAGRAMCVGALRGGTPDVVLDLERVGIGAARIG